MAAKEARQSSQFRKSASDPLTMLFEHVILNTVRKRLFTRGGRRPGLSLRLVAKLAA
jgi:hypothetical protein